MSLLDQLRQPSPWLGELHLFPEPALPRQHTNRGWYMPPPRWARKAPSAQSRRFSWQSTRRRWYTLPRRGA